MYLPHDTRPTLPSDGSLDECPTGSVSQARRRSRLIVEIDVNAVYGWGHEPEDHQQYLQNLLNETVPHYHPTVTVDHGLDDGNIDSLARKAAQEYPSSPVLAIKRLREMGDEHNLPFIGIREAKALVNKHGSYKR